MMNHAYYFRFIFSVILFSSLACCQLSTDWEYTFYLCLRCRSWQQVLGKWNQQWVFIGIRDPELKSIVFWVGLAVSKISSQFSVHSVWHSDRCSRRMFHHVLCQSRKRFSGGWLLVDSLQSLAVADWSPCTGLDWLVIHIYIILIRDVRQTIVGKHLGRGTFDVNKLFNCKWSHSYYLFNIFI